MNNEVQGSTRPAAVGAEGARSHPRHRGRGRAANRSGRPAAGGRIGVTALTPEAERLLRALAPSTARAVLDIVDPAFVVVNRMRRGVSLGGGRFGLAAAESLVRHDLARWGGTARTSLHVTEAGAAYLKRLDSPAGEDAFLSQHIVTSSAAVETEAGPARVRINAEESPLDWLRRRKGRDGEPLIDEACYQAGERLRRDITTAGMLPGVTARWEAPTSGPAGPGEATDRMIAARQRLRHAFEALGAEFSDLLIDLCGFVKGLELIERERGWPPRSGKVVVRLALGRLAEHYGLGTAARGPAASRGIRAWQAVVIEGGKLSAEP